MKKFFLGTLVLSGLLFACDKANVQNSPEELISADASSKTNGPPGELNRSRYVQGNRVECINPGFTCRLDKRVQPSEFVAITAASKATSTTISNIYSEYRAELTPYFSTDMIDGVINGSMSVKVHGSFEFGEKTYFSFYKGSEFIECAPLSK